MTNPLLESLLEFVEFTSPQEREVENLISQLESQLEKADEHQRIVNEINSQEFLEKLAELEHKQWNEWATTLLGVEHLTEERRNRWLKLMVDYKQLTEEQKEQDRKYARIIIEKILEGKK